MARTFIRQLTQIAESDTYDDTIAPTEANYETNADNIEDDLNSLRSSVHNLLKLRTGNWWDDVNTPSTFENGAQRGVNDLNQDLHDLQRKRILKRRALVGVDITPGTVQVYTLATGELPAATTAAVGAVTTLGTVVAQATTFGTASATDVVAGSNALAPKNLVVLTDGTTGDPLTRTSDGQQIYGLLQSENGTDGHTISDTTPNRVQISFVVRNGTNDGYVLASGANLTGVSFNHTTRERVALEDCNEEDFLGDGVIDAGVANVDRQATYDNQGTTAVELGNSASLDIGAGFFWRLRDNLDSALFTVTEGSGGGTTAITIESAVDTFDINAVVVDVDSGATVGSGGSRPWQIGVSDGVIATSAGNAEIRAATELLFDDGNQPGSWAQAEGVKLSEQASDWSTWETNFGGEVSIMEAMNATYALASAGGTRTRVQSTVTSNVSADNDVNGPGGANNLDVDLPAYDSVTFVTDVDVYLNGELLRNAPNDGGGEDVYPGTSAANGDLRFQFPLKGTGSKPDQITVIVNGQ